MRVRGCECPQVADDELHCLQRQLIMAISTDGSPKDSVHAYFKMFPMHNPNKFKWLELGPRLNLRKTCIGSGRGYLLEKGSFQNSPFPRDSREPRDSRDATEPPECGKQR